MNKDRPIWLFVWDAEHEFYTHTRLSPGFSFDTKQPLDPVLGEYIGNFLQIYNHQNPDSSFEMNASEYTLFDWDTNELDATQTMSQIGFPRIVFAVHATDTLQQVAGLRVHIEALPEPKKDLDVWLSEIGPEPSTLQDVNHLDSNRVFLVHGHNEHVLHQSARFLERLALDVVILREQPNSGRTIIEKFLDYADVAYAVVLLTGDDRGGVADPQGKDQRLRARQNVVLELGFFLGKLGRDRVCALYEDGVEIPSDYSGVLFTPLDPAGAWQFAVAKELKAAGFSIDLNQLVDQQSS